MAARTPAQWLQDEQEKAQLFDANRVHIAFSKGHGATMMLAMVDGLRSLISNCLAEQGLPLSTRR